MGTLRPALFLVAIALGTPLPGVAQSPDATPAPPAHVAFVDGSATIEREGAVDSLGSGMLLVDGDRLRTTAGRVEVLFEDGSRLYLDDASTVDLMSSEALRLMSGTMTLDVSADADASAAGLLFRVDTPAAAVTINAPGEYRISATGDQALVAVSRGAAQMTTTVGRVDLQAGEQSIARAGEVPGFPVRFNTAYLDPFSRWIEGRRTDRHSASVSQRYLPPPVQSYATTFDRNGSWIADPQYGSVWYPTVGGAWRPYHNGRWTWVARYGWTWVGVDPWAWPTHHYGRWGISTRGSWFWIPGHQWGPAWVSWAIGPSFVSWCPLGFNGRPVIGFSTQSPYIYDRVFSPNFGVYDRVFSPDFAWTHIPGHLFGTHDLVNRVAIPGHRLAIRDRAAVALQQTAPPRPRAGATRSAIRDAEPRPRGLQIPPPTNYAVPRNPIPIPSLPAPAPENDPNARPPRGRTRGGGLRTPATGDGVTSAPPAPERRTAQPRFGPSQPQSAPGTPGWPAGDSAPAAERLRQPVPAAERLRAAPPPRASAPSETGAGLPSPGFAAPRRSSESGGGPPSPGFGRLRQGYGEPRQSGAESGAPRHSPESGVGRQAVPRAGPPPNSEARPGPGLRAPAPQAAPPPQAPQGRAAPSDGGARSGRAVPRGSASPE